MPPELHPADLPDFASFAARTEATAHPYELEELAALPPRAVSARRRSFRLGRAAAHAALAELGADDGPILIGESRAPVWPDGIAGSIAHTSELGVALVAPAARTGGVGIDVERRRHAPELADQVPRPEEHSWLQEAPPAHRADLTLALFSAKESIFKAFYHRVGAFFGFDAALLIPTTRGWTARLVAELDAAYPPDRTFEVGRRWDGDLVMTWLVLPGDS